LVNQERANNGNLPPLKRVAAIDASAYGHSYDMGVNNFFSHTGSDGSLPWDRMRAQGYYYNRAGENIAAGYSSPASAMNGWMNSSGHRANILSGSYTELGVGYFYDDPAIYPGPWGYRHYWTQNFGRRSGVYPVVINREAYSTTQPVVDLYVYGPSDATQMRFSNDGVNWSAWQPYGADAAWTLTEGGSGARTVYAQVDTGSQTYQASDEILYAPTTPVLAVDPLDITFLSQQGSGSCEPVTRTARVSNAGDGTLAWEATEGCGWFDINANGDTVAVTCNDATVSGLATGTYVDSVTFAADGAENSPQTVSVTLAVVQELVRVYVPLVGR
jgi:hypothetical protein